MRSGTCPSSRRSCSRTTSAASPWSRPGPDRHFAANWVARYERGWAEGSRAGFAILDGDGAIVGFAGIFGLDDPGAEGEIGYLVAAEARGQGIAGRSVALLTRWGFDELGLERIELRIDTDNVASARVAERAGYRLDGVLRSKHFKEGLRTDLGQSGRRLRLRDGACNASPPSRVGV